jgi:hypothetical protein
MTPPTPPSPPKQPIGFIRHEDKGPLRSQCSFVRVGSKAASDSWSRKMFYGFRLLRSKILWAMMLLVATSSNAQTCRPPETAGETFEVFYSRFLHDRTFSISRAAKKPASHSEVPIPIFSVDITELPNSLVPRDMTAFRQTLETHSSLSALIEQQHLLFQNQTRDRSNVISLIYGKGVFLLLGFYAQKNGCWYLNFFIEQNPEWLPRHLRNDLTSP